MARSTTAARARGNRDMLRLPAVKKARRSVPFHEHLQKYREVKHLARVRPPVNPHEANEVES